MVFREPGGLIANQGSPFLLPSCQTGKILLSFVPLASCRETLVGLGMKDNAFSLWLEWVALLEHQACVPGLGSCFSGAANVSLYRTEEDLRSHPTTCCLQLRHMYLHCGVALAVCSPLSTVWLPLLAVISVNMVSEHRQVLTV